MASLDEKQVPVARVYGQAMLSLAEEADSAKPLLEELDGLVALLAAQPEFGAYLTSPLVDQDDRRAALERTLRGRSSDLLVDTLQVLNRNGRLSLLETVVETYRQAYQEKHDEIDVQVTTAVALDDDLRASIVALAQRLSGRRPALSETVDASLLGGMVLRVGDRKIDTSVAKDLKTIRAQLVERASREILSGRLSAAS